MLLELQIHAVGSVSAHEGQRETNEGFEIRFGTDVGQTIAGKIGGVSLVRQHEVREPDTPQRRDSQIEQ